MSILVVGGAMSRFLVISFLLCVLLARVSPSIEIHEIWFKMLPGVAPLTWKSTLLGAVEAALYGWYIAILFVPLYNAAQRKSRPGISL